MDLLPVAKHAADYEYTQAQLDAYKALEHAAERIAAGAWAEFRAKRKYRYGGSRLVCISPRGYTGPLAYLVIDSDLKRVQQAMNDVLVGTITPESAMALLWERDVLDKRTA